MTVNQEEEYRNEAYSIILMHIPPIADWHLQREMVEPLQQAAVLPDLMLCGHEHKYIWKDAGDPKGLAFPILVCSHKNVLSCSCSANHLQIKILDPDKNMTVNRINIVRK